MSITINLPASQTVYKGPRDKSWAASVTIDVTKLSADIVAHLAMHGLKQKLADAASQYKTLDEAQAAMDKAADALLAGQWTHRTSGGAGLTERDKVARIIVGEWFRSIFAKNNPKHAKVKAYKEADAAGRAAILDEIFADNEDIFADEVEAEMAARKAKAEKLGAVKVTIKA
jgi:hypothetical protein